MPANERIFTEKNYVTISEPLNAQFLEEDMNMIQKKKEESSLQE